MSTEMELAKPNGNGAMTRTVSADAALAREAQEVQAAMLVAKRCPRDEIEAERRILQACKRKGLAEQAMYAYPRGGQTVTGPSIRLAEVLAQNWGNMSCGVKELSQRNGESEMVAFAWDMETNFRIEKTFTVKHERHTKPGVEKLTDPRDIYELGANQGARRLRNCILAVIPGDITDSAVTECEKTLAGNNTEPIADRVKKMLVKFEEVGVTKAAIEKRLTHKVDAIIETELVNLRKIYKSIIDGFAKKEKFFPIEGGELPKSQKTAELEEAIKGKKKTDQPVDAEIEEKPEPAKGDETLALHFSDQIDDLATLKGSEKIGGEIIAKKDALGSFYDGLLLKLQTKTKTIK